jgi:membrane carboxypeptidase/penicillin-binding protein
LVDSGAALLSAAGVSFGHGTTNAHDEAAWLAAILPSPRRYDPLRKTTFLTRRHERILKLIDRQSGTSTSVAEE